MKINENKLKNIVTEAIKKVVSENYMSDEDIKAQYNGAKVTHLQVEPSRSGEGWTGTLEIIFPNADDIDFDSSVVDNFIVYDNAGNNIGFENWYPDVVVAKLKEFIQKEIAKKKGTIKESTGDNSEDKDQYAKKFLTWALIGKGSRIDVPAKLCGYYEASQEQNKKDAQWYLDEILRLYADALNCDETDLNVPAILKAIDEWGYFNYQPMEEPKQSIKESAGDSEPADVEEEIKDLHNNLNNAILNLGVIEELFEDSEIKAKLQSISDSILTIGREVDQIHSQLIATETPEGIFGMEDWANKGLKALKPGQMVADEVIEELSNGVPPTTYSRGYFQDGEVMRHDRSTGEALYLTFKKTKQGWEFVGIKPEL